MPEIVLPTPGPHMLAKLAHPARNKLLRMGRRWRKTTLGLIAAIEGHGPDRCWRGVLQGANIWFIDKSFLDATSVWAGVKEMLLPIATQVNERDRRIQVNTGGALTIKSAVKPASLVGDWRGIDGVVANEGAKWNPASWQHLRPALSDRKAWTIWPSTPNGYNYFKTLDDNAAPADEMSDAWAKWHEPSSGNPFWDPNEIEVSRRDGMTELMIQSEYYATFEMHGAASTYFEFGRAAHVREHEIDSELPLDLCISFAGAPAAWVVAQGDRTSGPERAIDEIAPKIDQSVRGYLDEFRRRYPAYARGDRVRVFGEVTGKSSARSDYEQVRAGLLRADHLVRARPFEEKDRVNAINMMLRDGRGSVRAFVSANCVKLIRDLEGMRNSDASFRVDHRTAGIGWHAAAWGAKMARQYPALLATLAAAKSPESSRWAGRPEPTPEAKSAYQAYWAAVRAGRIKRPDACEQCGKPGPVEADHRDYAKPLDVVHLCFSCHRSQNPAGGTVASAAAR